VSKIVTNTAGAQKTISSLELNDGQVIECDVLVQAIGSLTNTEWLTNTSVDISNGVLTDGAMRALTTSGDVVPDVFAVGDVARFPNPIFGGVPRRIEHWNIPIETAKRVGQVLAAKLNDHETFDELIAQQFAPIPSFWSDQFGMNLLAFGDLGLATESRLIDGDISGDCIWGYYKDGDLVGVCGIGMRSALQSYRKSFLLQPPTATTVGK
jgi:NADPH-dependent 2,4-dienoyl-CoA reductase/sulfur reductase-like enzyme